AGAVCARRPSEHLPSRPSQATLRSFNVANCGHDRDARRQQTKEGLASLLWSLSTRRLCYGGQRGEKRVAGSTVAGQLRFGQNWPVGFRATDQGSTGWRETA